MMARKKSPAYAKALIENRRRGFHPLNVDMIYGDDWSMARDRAGMESAAFVRLGAATRPYAHIWTQMIGDPVIALRPRDFAPGRFDFHCVAGVSVRVIDLAGGFDDYTVDQVTGEITRWGLFYDLLAEVAEFAAGVQCCSGVAGENAVDVTAYAYDSRTAVAGRMVWPRWWSAALDARLRDASDGLLADQIAVTAARAGMDARG
jgi:hypothetical protein